MKFLEYLLHDTSANMWNDAQRLMAINASYDQIINRVIESHEQWFYKTATLTKGTAEWNATPFDFPAAPAGINKILLVTDANGDPLMPITVQQKEYGYAPGANDDQLRVVDIGYWLAHDKLWVNSAQWTGSLRVYYIRKPARMQYGTAEAGTSTQMTLDLDTRPSIVNDYYNDITFSIREGTGAGEEAVASDYVGSTRVLTIDFTSTPDTGSVYSSVCELPDGHMEVVAIGAAIRALMYDVAQEPKLNQLKQWYTKLEFDLMDYLTNRQIQSSRPVNMTNLD
jgi:hypothetical protein